MRHFSTTAHAALLPQLRVLHASMRRHCAPFRLHVLTEDAAVASWCLTQDDVRAYSVADLLARHPDLAPECLPGPPRTPRELAIGWRWWLVVDLLKAGIGPVTNLDVDLWFVSSPEAVFEEIGGAEMAVSPHSFPRAELGLPGVTHESHIRYSSLNAGFVYFADLAPAAHFAELCREGPISEDRIHADGTVRWGEQGGEEIVAEAHGAHVIQHPGNNVGPWNVHGRLLARAADGALWFGGRPIVSFHFHSLRPGEQLANPVYAVNAQQAAWLYLPYAMALGAAEGAP